MRKRVEERTRERKQLQINEVKEFKNKVIDGNIRKRGNRREGDE